MSAHAYGNGLALWSVVDSMDSRSPAGSAAPGSFECLFGGMNITQ
jgi:hypothetical protein